VALASALVADGGELLACTNHHRLEERDVLAAVRTGLGRAGRSAGALELVPPPPDFPTVPGRSPELKSVWARL
jgi:23S rRNA G2069 N7-methylase RlmK/C1962 C5-methylase RlmI